MEYYYEKKIELQGEPAKAMDMLLMTFTQSGFRIIKQNSTTLELEGPGISNTRQNPIAVISNIKFDLKDKFLTAQAILGGVSKIKRFLITLISGMALFFVILFGIIFSSLDTFRNFGIGYLLLFTSPFSIWIVLIPVMIKMIRKKTERALDIALENAKIISKGYIKSY